MKSARSSSNCPRCGQSLSATDHGNVCTRCLTRNLFDDTPELESHLSAEPVLRRIGNFELIEEIASGGMGVVFRARHVGLARIVALKLMRETSLATPQMVDRFQAEAAAASQLKHPRIVAIHESGVEAGQYYFAMDLIEGPDLAKATAAGPLPIKTAARLAITIAEAVQHAHERGIVHRDLKPSNVILDSSGEPNICDFGLARPLDESNSLTATGQVLGTPGYMAPEQAGSNAIIGPTTDVYGLGSLFFHLLTGRAPFVGSGWLAVINQVLHSEPISPRLLNPAVTEDLAAVCLKCLRKAPSDRYRSANELVQELGRFLRGEPTLVRPTGTWEHVWRWCRRKPALASAISATVLAVFFGLAGTTWQWRKAQNALTRTQILAAHLRRQSGEIGQRHDALKLIAEAARHEQSSELRTEAIAALAKLDLNRQNGEWVSRSDDDAKIRPPTYAVSPDGSRSRHHITGLKQKGF